MKNVCFFYSDITGTGGIEKCISILSNELINEQNYNINIVSVKADEKIPFFPFDSRIKIDYLYKQNGEKRKLSKTIKLLRKYIKENKIDLLIVANTALAITVIPATLFTKTKTLYWEHFGFNDKISNKIIKISRFLATKLSDYIVVLTKYDKEQYKKNFHIRKKVQLMQIYNPITNLEYKGIIQNSKNILTVGHFLPVKGYDILVEVMNKVLNKNPDWTWCVVGDGPYYQYVEQKIKEYNLQDQVIIKSKIKNIDEYYKNSEIYVNTSRSEGLPLTILEAKAYNLPIVGFNIPGLVELIEDNENGILIEKYDIEKMQKAICELIMDKNLREKFSRNAKKRIEEFTKDDIIEKWKNIINEV